MAEREDGGGAAPKDGQAEQNNSFIIVGIGASAGGIEATKSLFSTMPEDSGMAFVLIQHLDPTHESLMPELMGRYTRMSVRQADEGMTVEPNSVYIIPPNKTLSITGNRLHVAQFEQRRGMRTPIDTFFRSLAEDRGERAVGIVLSGTASDGTLGLKEIKLHGGLTIAQDPAEAQHDGMPRSALNSGAVDYALPAAEMPTVLQNYAHHPYVTSSARGGEHEPAVEGAGLDGVLALLRARLKHDFRGYKKSTLMRRVERRMSLHDIQDMEEFREFLREHPAEVKNLLNDLLIGVTSFFREPEAWEDLSRRVIRPLVASRSEEEESIRVWVPGCANGKEAYTLAMLLIENADAVNHHLNAQIFATDIDLDALDAAREAVYPEEVAGEVVPGRLKRFFTKQGEAYQVRKEVRDMVTFAEQNLVTDPPFSRMDLISCRNLLIYLEPKVQGRLIDLFHFALRRDGHLFLGVSESVGRREGTFKTVSRKWRIYMKTGDGRVGELRLPLVDRAPRHGRAEIPEPADEGERVRLSPAQLTDRILADQFAKAAVLIDADHNVLYYHGDTEDFLRQPAGEPTRSLLVLVREGLRGRLRGAIRQARQRDQAVELSANALRGPKAQPTRIMVLPLGRERLTVVAFERTGEMVDITADSEGAEQAVVDSLEDELKSTRLDLQNTIEELETSNEELKASNEEAMSMNEELQSTNEELETSKEELQSLNEELTTVNSQLQEKVEELEATNDDLDNLINSTEFAVLFLDPDLRLKRFTPEATQLFNLIGSDVGRPVSDPTGKLSTRGFQEDAQRVLKELQPVRTEVRGEDGRWYVRRALPYRTHRNTVEGVVITFTDVSDIRQAQESEKQRRQELEAVMESAPAAVWIAHDPECRRATANRRGYEMLRLPAGSNVSLSAPEPERPTSFRMLKEGRELAPEEQPLQRAAASGDPVESFEKDIVFEDGQGIHVIGSAAPLTDAEGRPRGAVAVFLDVSELKRVQESLRTLNEELEQRVAERTEAFRRQAEQLRDLAWQLTDAEQQERRRLARLLHDHLQQLLVSAKIRLSMNMDDAPDEVAEGISKAVDLLNESIGASRNLTVELSPPVLYEVGLASALRWLADRMHEQQAFSIDVECEIPDGHVEEHRRVLVFDCIRELLLNSSKHSGLNRASVQVREDADGSVRAVVSDSGRGFDPEVLQTRRRRSRFGLFHIQQRLDSVGGHLDIQSAPGQGVVTTFVCPVGDAGRPARDAGPRPIAADRPEGLPRSPGAPVRVLVVDDHDIFRQGVCSLLSAAPDIVVVGEAANGEEAVAQAGNLMPDVVLMDINMPKMNGTEATEAITRQYPAVRVIGLSVHAETEIAESMEKAGAAAYVSKDSADGEVVEAIRRVTGAPGDGPSLPEPSEEPAG